MKRISNLRLPSQVAVFTSADATINAAITGRMTLLAGLSGVPIPSNVIGRIHRQISLKSIPKMLESIRTLRNLSKLASDILKSMVIYKMDRQQMIRTEVLAYIQANAENYGMKDITTDQIEFVSHLITSSDDADSSWLLDLPVEADSNLICNFSTLFASLSDEISVSTSSRSLTFDKGVTAIYIPSRDEIADVSSTIPGAAIIAAYKKVQKEGDNNESKRKKAADSSEPYVSKLVSISNINRLSLIRVVDHVMALLLDTDIWKVFLTPRTSSDAAENKVRADGLLLFASYLHSLLMYPHIFSIEAFRGTYSSLQTWLVSFPSLPSHLVADFDHGVARYDVLGAVNDVNTILSDMQIPKDQNLETHVMGFMAEFAHPFEIDEIIRKAELSSRRIPGPVRFESFAELKKPEFSPLLLSQPVSEADMTVNLTAAILTRNTVKELMEQAIDAIAPGMPRYFPDDVIGSLKEKNLRIAYKLAPAPYYTNSVTSSTTATVHNGTVHLSPHTPIASYDYQMAIRRDKMYEVFRGSDIINDGQFAPRAIMNESTAAYLRDVLNQNWRSLMPSSMVYGDRYLTANMLASNEEAVRNLFESMSGDHFELIIRTIADPYVRERWATHLSSFALLYVLPSDEDISKLTGEASIGSLSSALVVGFGKPYGCDYIDLASAQKPAKIGDMIKVCPGVYIRFLDKIKLPGKSMSVNPSFYSSRPYYYYPGNSEFISVEKWVMSDSLLHMTFSPILGMSKVPPVLFDRRSAYLNDALYWQLDIGFSLTRDTLSQTFFSAPAVEHKWTRSRYTQWITYKRLSAYTQTIESKHLSDEAKEETTNLLRALEATTTAIETEHPVTRMSEASPAIASSHTITPKEGKGPGENGGTKKAKDKKKGADDGSDEESKDDKGEGEGKTK